MGIGILGTLAQSYFVSPEDLGYFRSFGIYTGYAFALNMGITSGLSRLYPLYIGRNEQQKAIAVVEISHSYTLIISSVIAFIFFCLAIFDLISGNWKAFLGWMAQSFGISGFIYGGHLNATFRSGHEFKTLSKSTILNSVFGLIFIPLFFFIPYFTMAARSIFSASFNMIYLHIYRPVKVKIRFTVKEFLALLKEGFPLFIGGYGISTFWSVVESTLIIKYYGAFNFGLWSIAFMVSEFANRIPQAFNMVYTPRIIEEYGRTTNIKYLLKMIKKPILWGVPLMLLVGALSNVVLYFVVPVIMPKYISALPAMYLFMLILPLGILELPQTILIASGYVLKYNYSVLWGIATLVVFSYVFIEFEFSFLYIIIASLLARLLSRILAFIYIAKLS